MTLTYNQATQDFINLNSSWNEMDWWRPDTRYPETQAIAIARLVDQRAILSPTWPPPKYLYRAVALCYPEKCKVVILGQDPYPSRGTANGLAFSVQPKLPIPASLKNIFKELRDDLGIDNTSGFLLPWAKQGVLLLNNALTVAENQPGSHSALWKGFSEQVIKLINARRTPAVFVLWGNQARRFASKIEPRHLVVESYHPSPLAAAQKLTKEPFLGSRPFSKVNNFLAKHKLGEIDWRT